ncbi:MAG: hypothetical protein ISR82_01595 [Candidatus Marinimicrobia bacterium]|nr:hypothetical protein [Candidatus Neomarinimicrobiota bacterium]MBL7009900.1 hypothetical protein [Candidatus Neomarinimicrobiota bacterium]MBL7030149.1 hypothetical protein [Candidatus Neomarinimicrobiota bacterium]
MAQPIPDTLRFENIPDVIRLAKQDAYEDFKNSGSLKWVGIGTLPLIPGKLLAIMEEDFDQSGSSYGGPLFMFLNMIGISSVFIIPIEIPGKRYYEYVFEDKSVRRQYEKTYTSSIVALRMMHTLPFQLFSFFILFSNIFRLPIA